MSLHALANHLQEAGRGQDKVLVHMTPKEVSGLQSLAMAHGGSLTVNPETGLPEAGFLSSILPMIAGFALNAFLPGVGTAIGSALGTSGAVGTGILVGGATGLAKGSLKEGIMAGLGAYGGAGMAEGLASAGADRLGNGLGEFGSTAGQGTGADYSKFLGDTGQKAVSNMPQTVVDASGAGVNTLNNGFTGYQAQGPFAGTGINASNYTAQLSPQPSVLTNAEETLRSGLANPPITTTVNPTDYAYDPISKAIGEGQIKAVNSPLGVGADVNAMSSHYAKPIQEAATYQTGTYTPPPSKFDKIGEGFSHIKDTGFQGVKDVWNATPTGTGMGLAATGMSVMQDQQEEAAREAAAANAAAAAERSGYIRPYEYSTALTENAFAPRTSTSENRYFVEPRFTAGSVYKVKDGGLMSLPNYAVGGPVEDMSAQNAISGNMMYPQSQLQTDMYSNPMVQRPMPTNVISMGVDAPVDRYTGEQRMASGGVSSLGGYSDGGRLLRGPGDGVSDSIPASIGDRQPARLADGEFVVPARIVSEIGNGSTEAGARKLYAMMNRVQHARKKTVGKDQVAKNTKAERLLPA